MVQGRPVPIRPQVRGTGRRRIAASSRGEAAAMGTVQKTWFGHPAGLTILFLTQTWEQFSYYGMRAIVVYYMLSDLMMSQAQSSMIFGVYNSEGSRVGYECVITCRSRWSQIH